MRNDKEPYRIRMTPEQWALIEDNPIQRDTAAHARRAKHLREPDRVHGVVNMAELPDGDHVKLDGHSRSLLWTTGALKPPPNGLLVDVWPVDDMEEVKRLYDTFDNRAAADTTTDQLYGAARSLAKQRHLEAGQQIFSSSLLTDNRFGSALTHATDLLYTPRERDKMRNMLNTWIDELELLDLCDPKKDKFYTGVTTGALLIFRRYGADGLKFWQDYSKGRGIKIGDKYSDPVQAFTKKVEDFRALGKTLGAKNVAEIAILAISAFERHRRNEVYGSTGVRSVDFSKWRKETLKHLGRDDILQREEKRVR